MKHQTYREGYYVLFLLLICSIHNHAQTYDVFLSRNYEYKFQRHLSKQDVSFHPSIRPFTLHDIKKDEIQFRYGKPFGKLNEKDAKATKVKAGCYPIVELGAKAFTGTEDSVASDLGVGAAGILRIGESLNARMEFSASRFQLPEYLRAEAEEHFTLPNGQFWHQSNSGYHSTNLNGFLDYKPGQVFNFRIGRGRNFIGEGYRSLMLSDNAGNYNYGRVTADVWHLKYMVLYAHLRDVGSSLSRDIGSFEHKFSTIHYLSWNITKWFNLGFFESVVWPGRDTLLDRGFDVNYLNPVIFMRPVEYSLGSSDNSLLGMAFNFKPTNGWSIYSQFVLDEFLFRELTEDMKDLVQPNPARQSGWWANKYSIQLGFKGFDVFGLKGLGVQSEMNLVRPFTYSHGSSVQNFGHLNRPLAHPLGSNFIESITFFSYQKGNHLVELKFQYFQQGSSTDSTNFGEDIFRPYRSRSREYGHYLGQGVGRDVTAIGLTHNYVIIPETNLRFFADITYRKEVHRTNRTDFFLSVGIRSSITNRYTDI